MVDYKLFINFFKLLKKISGFPDRAQWPAPSIFTKFEDTRMFIHRPIIVTIKTFSVKRDYFIIQIRFNIYYSPNITSNRHGWLWIL